MKRLSVGKYSLSDLLSQVFSDIHAEILAIYKTALEQALESCRDHVIGNRRYGRGFPYKRWGYTIRKWIQTPIGLLQHVKIPRVRGYGREIGLLIDRCSSQS